MILINFKSFYCTAIIYCLVRLRQSSFSVMNTYKTTVVGGVWSNKNVLHNLFQTVVAYK